ncbi:hypothetical protein MRX96_056998 [Rhipicephalus microplus]
MQDPGNPQHVPTKRDPWPRHERFKAVSVDLRNERVGARPLAEYYVDLAPLLVYAQHGVSLVYVVKKPVLVDVLVDPRIPDVRIPLVRHASQNGSAHDYVLLYCL